MEKNRESLVTAMRIDKVKYSARLSYNSAELKNTVPLVPVKVPCRINLETCCSINSCCF